jgi:dTDP-4-dehydrorhamnose reductase
MEERILVLGASSWLGHYLVPALIKSQPSVRVVGTYAHKEPSIHVSGFESFQCSSSSFSDIEKLDFSTVVNLTRGETQTDFEFHQSMIALMNHRAGRYVYASSSNAVDRDVSKAHFETDQVGAQSEYGQFKARCESELFKYCRRPLAFRFSATHGWAPNRIARTEEFLKKLSSREPVVIQTGIVQNRTFVGSLASQISKLVFDPYAEGVFHLGTSDSSDECDFLRKMANAFGYRSDQVISGEVIGWNLVTVVKNFQDRYPDFSIPTESETIKWVRAQPELASYIC